MTSATVTSENDTAAASRSVALAVSPPRLMTWAARMAIAGIVLFNAGWLLAESYQEQQYSPRRDYLSAMAAVDAAQPWMMVGAFLAAAVASCALGIGLAIGLQGRLAKVPAVGCVLSGVGLCVSALARPDCNIGRPECADRVDAGLMSKGHEVHDVASALVFITAGLTQLMMGRALRGRDGHRQVRAPSLALGGLGLGLFVYMAVLGATDWTGTVERILVLTSSLWVCVVGVHLDRPGRHDERSRRDASTAFPGPRSHEPDDLGHRSPSGVPATRPVPVGNRGALSHGPPLADTGRAAAPACDLFLAGVPSGGGHPAHGRVSEPRSAAGSRSPGRPGSDVSLEVRPRIHPGSGQGRRCV